MDHEMRRLITACEYPNDVEAIIVDTSFGDRFVSEVRCRHCDRRFSRRMFNVWKHMQTKHGFYPRSPSDENGKPSLAYFDEARKIAGEIHRHNLVEREKRREARDAVAREIVARLNTGEIVDRTSRRPT